MNQINMDFNGLSLALIETDDGDFCLSADQAAQALGYADTAGFHRLMKRNAKLITAHKGVVKLTTPGGMQDVTVISEQGLYLLAMKSNTAPAEEFQLRLSQVVKEIRKGKFSVAAIPQSESEKLAATVNQLAGMLGGSLLEVKALAAATDEKVERLAAAESDHEHRISAVEQERADRLKVNEILGEIKTLGERTVKIRATMSWSRFYRECQRAAGVSSLKAVDRVSLHSAELAYERARELADAPSKSANEKWEQLLSATAERHAPTFMVLSRCHFGSIDHTAGTCTVIFPTTELAMAVSANLKQVAFIESGLSSVFGEPLRLRCTGKVGA
jgi:prophage antirepressor-like protein